ncbi:hypothetical protein [Bacillus swezeyi]|uniref:hypothetical protein n=1 Tax=Bacillus swezeyi TaxID=1925020 RepID=UPI0027DE12D5|nr:hypothetical protein [Bacillus swezeyi]
MKNTDLFSKQSGSKKSLLYTLLLVHCHAGNQWPYLEELEELSVRKVIKAARRNQ